MGLEVECAEGVWIQTTDGRRFIDLIAGISVSTLGHRHPRVLEAIERQLARHLHVMVYGEFIIESQVRLASTLAAHLAERLNCVYFTNSGAEAVEGALKLARKRTGRALWVCLEGAYHGDTLGALSVCGWERYRVPFKPLLQSKTIQPNNFKDLTQIDRSVAAVIAEPIQAEAGMRALDPEWLKAVRERCDEVGALLIFDEIQTGLGRTGTLFAYEHYGVIPDILCLAKALGGGMPLGAFVADRELMWTLAHDPPLSHITTFGGHPVSCAAGLAALQVLIEERLWERARWIEQTTRRFLESHPAVQEIRGRGALLGIVLRDQEGARRAVRKALQAGLIIGGTLHTDNVLRIAPPLIISEEELTTALRILQDVLACL
ncbi:MAG: aspartate aminotransferase family protein [Bacteroidetes bacterium]|nr:aspartate aminotransferase family protein [Rhodothermia bacterium]MCS7155639.1 aspartate aminotransferase family protein [Bacteroidota bacterium]MCX7906498.1 aspartate aminotransferase family protein [Bacteroidota bacterium]MDW8137221.1 aspartate aminotransferase family protein [Bacteroidota bacterium]MDW8284909.1 aspartate aminotransferase family protein [Bacteroidota bacterium]